MNINAAYARFRRDRKTFCAARTIEWYGYMCAPLLDKWGGAHLETINADGLRRLATAQNKRLSRNTLAMMIRGWKTVFRWWVREGLLTSDPSVGLTAPKIVVETLALSREDTGRLLDCVDAGGWPGDVRDRALIYLLLDTGLRAAEACGLLLCDCDLVQGVLTVQHGKGGKCRQVAIRPATAALLAALSGRRTSGRLLRSRTGRRLNPNSMRLALVRIGARCGLALYPHLLRHTSATLFVELGGNAFLLQELLGHTTIAMTERYTKKAKQRAALKSHGDYSPIEALRRKDQP